MNKTHIKIIFGALLLIHSQAFSKDILADQEKALSLIANFATKICNSIPVEGQEKNIELTGNGKVEVGIFLRKFAKIGVDTTGKYTENSYKGVLQKQLAEILITSEKCKTDISDKLINKMILDTNEIVKKSADEESALQIKKLEDETKDKEKQLELLKKKIDQMETEEKYFLKMKKLEEESKEKEKQLENIKLKLEQLKAEEKYLEKIKKLELQSSLKEKQLKKISNELERAKINKKEDHVATVNTNKLAKPPKTTEHTATQFWDAIAKPHN